MKIAIISPHFFPYVEFGGPVSSLWGLSKKLSKFYSINIFTIYNGKNIFFKIEILIKVRYIRMLNAHTIKNKLKIFFLMTS